MNEVERLLNTIKRQLRRRGLTYRDVAVALELSEASVKRLFASGRMTLDRLARLADLLGLTLAELTQQAAAMETRLRELSVDQEAALVSDIRLMLVAVCALNHWTLSDIVAGYRLTEAECIERLLRLERLRLIDLLPGNRIRIVVARDFAWRPDGPIRRYFQRHGQDDFLADAFNGDDGEMSFVHGMLTAAASLQLRGELARLKARFADLHDEGQSAALAERRGTGLLLAYRAWEPPEFAALRRREPAPR